MPNQISKGMKVLSKIFWKATWNSPTNLTRKKQIEK